jgi:phosphoribosylaminoimidazole (AIR) synthetase
MVVPGLPIVGFWEPGYRCNGGTFFTNIIQAIWGKDPRHVMRDETAHEFVRRLTVPSVSYARLINELQGWNPDGTEGTAKASMYGIAHITGGGIWGKLGEQLPVGVGANLDKMPLPAGVLREAQDLSWDTEHRLSDWKAHRTLHGGCGMLVVTDRESMPRIIYEAMSSGVQAFHVGETTDSPESEILIQSRFRQSKELSSLHPE